MKPEEAQPGMPVVYARGAKGPLIGKHGTIVSEVRDGVCMVEFVDPFGPSPCMPENLDRPHDHLRYLAAVYLNEPMNPDFNSRYARALRALVEACRADGVDHHAIMREVLNELKEESK